MNILRTVLSLLGVTVGVFAIIAVFTLVDSLESQLKSSFNFLGTDNLNIEKWPYGFSGDYPWWKYLNRPYPNYEEFQFLEKNVRNAAGITIVSSRSGVLTKFQNSSSAGNNLIGASYGYRAVVDLPIVEGRYFTFRESSLGSNAAIIGHRIKEDLFPNNRKAVGQPIKIRGLKYVVIGVLEEEGDGFLGLPSKDDNIIIPYQSFRKIFYAGRYNGVPSTISLKGLSSDPRQVKLEGELRGFMRVKRGLRPREEDDFAINRPDAIASFIGTTFDVVSIAGWVIGSFSILVGGFGIANIMFVSVKERTPIIGIQKSLGAKNYFILLQFLFEAVFLSILGGTAGIIIVYALTFLEIGSLSLVLTSGNILLGLVVSVIVGIISGIVPASMAARLDPVIAIRS